MKINIYEDPTIQEDYVTIYCSKKTSKIEELQTLIEQKDNFPIIGMSENHTHLLQIDDILYFESVDKKCFAYLNTEVFQVDYTLKDLESVLMTKGFLRINRSTIVNIYKIDHIQFEYNMRIYAYLINKEKMIISRHYNKAFQANIQKIKSQLLGG